MPVQKIKSGRIITVEAPTYVGEKGTIFYDEDTPELRLSDGFTPGGILISSGGGGSSYVLPIATTSTLGGIKVGQTLVIGPDGTLNLNTATVVSDSFKRIKVANNPDLVASGADTVEFIAGNGITIETSTTSTPFKTMTLSSEGILNIDGGFVDTNYDVAIQEFDGGQP